MPWLAVDRERGTMTNKKSWESELFGGASDQYDGSQPNAQYDYSRGDIYNQAVGARQQKEASQQMTDRFVGQQKQAAQQEAARQSVMSRPTTASTTAVPDYRPWRSAPLPRESFWVRFARFCWAPFGWALGWTWKLFKVALVIAVIVFVLVLASSPKSSAPTPPQPQPSPTPVVGPWFGIGFEDLTADNTARLRLSPGAAAYVRSVVANSPAALANLAAGDVVLDVGGHGIQGGNGLKQALAGATVGTPIAVDFIRGGRFYRAWVTPRARN
jgi:hypothetical protein